MIIPPTAFADPGFPPLVERWTAQGRRPFLLTEKGGVRWFSHGTSQVLNPTGYETLSTSYLFQSPTERPERVVPLRLNYHLIPLEEW